MEKKLETTTMGLGFRVETLSKGRQGAPEHVATEVLSPVHLILCKLTAHHDLLEDSKCSKFNQATDEGAVRHQVRLQPAAFNSAS